MIVSEINIKLTILGYWGVGKTSMTNAFMDKEIPSMYIPTIGSNIIRKEFKLRDEYIRVNIWDIGGQRSFNPLNPVFFSNIDAAFLVFDLTNPKETLLELKQTYLKNLRNGAIRRADGGDQLKRLRRNSGSDQVVQDRPGVRCKQRNIRRVERRAVRHLGGKQIGHRRTKAYARRRDRLVQV